MRHTLAIAALAACLMLASSASAEDVGAPADDHLSLLADAHDALRASADAGSLDDPAAALWTFTQTAHEHALALHRAGDRDAAMQAASRIVLAPPVTLADAEPDAQTLRVCLALSEASICSPRVDAPKQPSSALVLTDLGYFLHRGGKHEAAAHLLTQVASAFPEHMPTWLNLADALGAMGDYANAYVAYQRWVALRAARGMPEIDQARVVERVLEHAADRPDEPAPTPKARPSGCGCATPTHGAPPTGVAILLLALVARLTRWRPPRSRSS